MPKIFNLKSMSFLDQLDWRRAEKNFDPEYTLPAEALEKILHAVKMAPTSFGLQPYHVYVVQDQATKDKLREKGYGQAQFSEASAVLVFAARTDIEDRVQKYQELSQAPQQYVDVINGFVQNMDAQSQQSWAQRQTYIALGFALAAAAELQIDSCPMEGLDSAGFNEILNVQRPLNTVVALPLGKRKEEDSRPKVRFSDDDLFTTV